MLFLLKGFTCLSSRDQELAQIQAAQRAEEEKEKKVQDELEARREKKRQMREMSLDDILKMSKNKPKRSPTLSIRSEASGSIRRASSESLNKDEVEGKNKKKLSASSSCEYRPLFENILEGTWNTYLNSILE